MGGAPKAIPPKACISFVLIWNKLYWSGQFYCPTIFAFYRGKKWSFGS